MARAIQTCETTGSGQPMWIVKVALDRPYTFIVLALLIVLLSPVVILRTPTDIFPDINIPVISVGWTYSGLNPEELEGRLTSPFEKSVTTLVDNIEHLESTTYNGMSVIKIFLQPGASLDTANAQVTAASQFMLRQLPPGTLPQQIINFSASYDAAVANYRQTALVAFQQVEDNLAALRVLETESQQQKEATASAQQSLDLFETRYEGGVDTYLQVVTWQTAALLNERAEIDLMRRRLDASVLLIKALGGGWHV